ncbi:MAG TPA: 50S ribosomal protein L35 [Candidatus Binataceae bacterium]|nr:50S ribosomal protein L35 [Candidatus Binataceae bacterium]
MPKLKSNRAAAKRFKATKTGRIKYKKAYLRHLNSSKSRARKRHLRKPAMLGKTETQQVHALLPYARHHS